MTKFIGAEYVIANLLINKMQSGKEIVSLLELNSLGVQVQRIVTEESFDAVFLTSRSEIFHAIYDFTDYFQCEFDEDDQLVGVTINKNKKIKDLEERFVGYIPVEIVNILRKAIDQIAA